MVMQVRLYTVTICPNAVPTNHPSIHHVLVIIIVKLYRNKRRNFFGGILGSKGSIKRSKLKNTPSVHFLYDETTLLHPVDR